MAIDSEKKRASALYFFRHRKGRLISDGTISGADLQDIVGLYVGISAVSSNIPVSFAYKRYVWETLLKIRPASAHLRRIVLTDYI